MAEIAALPKNGYKAASTFSGCGGSSLGYKMAGFTVVWANEFIPAAADTYRANHPETILSTADIRTIGPAEFFEETGLKEGELDLLDGSPPCASFSTAGRRSEGWGAAKKYSDTVQRVDDLFDEYVRLVRGIKPRIFVAENVSGLVKGVARGYFKKVFTALKESGYRVGGAVCSAEWLGVPQARERLILIGVRSDLMLDPVYPAPLPYRYTVEDAIGDLRGAEVEEAASIEGYAIGREYDRITQGQKSKKYLSLVRAKFNEPCPTITQTAGITGAAGVVHPTEKRKFSIAELRRLSGFPDDFILTGSYQQQYERIGRAVPPPMMEKIALAASEVLKRADARRR
jgi:DNA (cytosine-5)-methyltransferase 1